MGLTTNVQLFRRHDCPKTVSLNTVLYQFNIYFLSLNSFLSLQGLWEEPLIEWPRCDRRSSLTFSSSEPAVCPALNLDLDTLADLHSSESLWKSDTEAHIDWQSFEPVSLICSRRLENSHDCDFVAAGALWAHFQIPHLTIDTILRYGTQTPARHKRAARLPHCANRIRG